MISNAGAMPIGPIDDLAVEDWEQMIGVNIKGVLYGIAAALPVFREQEAGHFMNIVSTADRKTVPGKLSTPALRRQFSARPDLSSRVIKSEHSGNELEDRTGLIARRRHLGPRAGTRVARRATLGLDGLHSRARQSRRRAAALRKWRQASVQESQTGAETRPGAKRCNEREPIIRRA